MKLPVLKKLTNSDKMLNQLKGKHDFLDNIKKFSLPNKIDIDFNIDSINTYWVQKENLWTKKQKKQLWKHDLSENISYINQNISSDNTYRYMGKVMKNRDSEYSPEFIIWSLQYLFEKIPYGKVNFVIWSKVSEIMNGAKDIKDAMSIEEQKDYIMYYAYQYFPERVNDLNIIDIQQNHPDLFSTLESNPENPLDTLDSNDLPNLDTHHISSLKIAKHLYIACKNDKNLDNRIRSLTPPNLEEKTESSYYYGLIEIAIRLTDYLNWITIQWWKYGQGKYDQFIKTIIMWSYKNYWWEGLEYLSQFCKEVLKNKNQKFATIHLKTKEYEQKIRDQEIVERRKKDKIAQKHNMYKNIVITALAISTLFGLGYLGVSESKKNDKAKIEEKINLENQKKLADKKLWYSLTNYSNFGESNDKIRVLNDWASNVYNILTKRYIENFDESKEEELISMIKDELIRSDQINQVNIVEYLNWQSNSFIKYYLFPNHINQLMRLWFTDIPYEWLNDDISSMHNTLQDKENIIYKKDNLSKIPKEYQKMYNWWYKWRTFQYLWEYTNDWWWNYKIWYIYLQSNSSGIVWTDINELVKKQSWDYIPWNIYFLASKDGKVYTKELWLEVINSWLSEWYPLLNDIINFVWEDNIDKNKIAAEFLKWLRKEDYNDINLTKQQKIDRFLEYYKTQK